MGAPRKMKPSEVSSARMRGARRTLARHKAGSGPSQSPGALRGGAKASFSTAYAIPRKVCSEIAAFEFRHCIKPIWRGRAGSDRSSAARGGNAVGPRTTDAAAIQKVSHIVTMSMTRAALAAGLLFTGLSSGLTALAQDYPPPPPPPPGYAPPPGAVVVPTAPPPLRVEVVPAPPPYQAIWQPGFWRWDGRGYRWVRGHYVRPPRARHEWVAGHWEPRPGGHIWIEGFWR